MGGMFSKPKIPPPPKIQPPAPMPDPEDSNVKALRKKEAAMRSGKSGRDSTTALGEYGL